MTINISRVDTGELRIQFDTKVLRDDTMKHFKIAEIPKQFRKGPQYIRNEAGHTPVMYDDDATSLFFPTYETPVNELAIKCGNQTNREVLIGLLHLVLKKKVSLGLDTRADYVNGLFVSTYENPNRHDVLYLPSEIGFFDAQTSIAHVKMDDIWSSCHRYYELYLRTIEGYFYLNRGSAPQSYSLTQDPSMVARLDKLLQALPQEAPLTSIDLERMATVVTLPSVIHANAVICQKASSFELELDTTTYAISIKKQAPKVTLNPSVPAFVPTKPSFASAVASKATPTPSSFFQAPHQLVATSATRSSAKLVFKVSVKEAIHLLSHYGQDPIEFEPEYYLRTLIKTILNQVSTIKPRDFGFVLNGLAKSILRGDFPCNSDRSEER